MIHEVKIPTGCKASVSVDNEKIVVLIDPVEDFVKIDEEDKKEKALNVHPGMVVKSETGHIALVGSSDYTVVLTPSKEIQLNQTCNFPFEHHATKEESEELFEQLKMQKALQVSSSGMLKNWDPDNDEKYEVLDSLFDPVPIKCSYSSTYVRLRDAGNMFPVGFITEERQQQLKETLKNLFDSWRK